MFGIKNTNKRLYKTLRSIISFYNNGLSVKYAKYKGVSNWSSIKYLIFFFSFFFSDSRETVRSKYNILTSRNLSEFSKENSFNYCALNSTLIDNLNGLFDV